MTQLVHWNPFKSLGRSEGTSPFDDFFRHLGLRNGFKELNLAPDIRIDVKEDEKSYRVRADIPGVKREDIEVRVTGRDVSITAKATQEAEHKAGTEIYSDRREEQAFRSFSLPQDIAEKKVEAKYADGVLTLVLPKAKEGAAHRIEVA